MDTLCTYSEIQAREELSATQILNAVYPLKPHNMFAALTLLLPNTHMHMQYNIPVPTTYRCGTHCCG